MSKDFKEIYSRVMQERADKKGMTLGEYLEFDGICYQHTQGYYKDVKECNSLLKRYWELINLGKKRLSLKRSNDE